MNHWTDAKLCQLVTLYSQFNNLWDKSHPCYFKTQCRYESYDKIRKSLSTPGVTVIQVLSKLWDLRNGYVAELRKVHREKKRNSLYRPSKKWFYTMHQFLYDYLDPDEKPSDDSCESICTSSTSSLAGDQKCLKNKNQLRITKWNKSGIERGNCDERRREPMRFERSCVKFPNHYSQRGDEANLSKCCEDKVKESELAAGHFSKSRRRLVQNSTFEQLHKTDKFLSKGSKRGQCTSSPYFKPRHQDQEYRSNNLQTSKLWVPTSSELRRSTPKPTSCQREGFSCCSNCSCCCKTTNGENSNISDKFNLLNSDNVFEKAEFGVCNQNNRLGAKENLCGCGETTNVSSSDSVNSGKDDTFQEVDNNLNDVRRVLCLDELSDHVTKALNEMFMKLCPVDIACFNSYCTNETCKDAEKDQKENGQRKSTSSAKNKNENEIEEKNFNNDESKNSIVQVSNGKENRQSGESSEDKTIAVEDDNFSQFGTEVARVLKESNREKALRLKAAIKQTLESAKEEG